MTLVSRILGYVRDTFIAALGGAGPATDAFFVVFRIPNLLRRLFAEGAFAQAFVPVIAECRTRQSPEDVRALVADVSGTLGGALLLVSAAGVLAAPLLIAVFAPGFLQDAERYGLAVQMLRISFPYILFVSLTALAGGVLNTYERFGVPAFTPALLNLAMIGAALWLAPHLEHPVHGLAWGVLLGGIAQLGFQLPFLHRLGMLVRPRLRPRAVAVRRILRLMLPAMLGVAVSQLSLLLNTVLASFLAAGSVSWLYFSDRLVEFPLGVFGVALATVLLPSLARSHAQASPQMFNRSLDWALRWVVLLGAPAALGLVLLGGPTVATLFMHGQFSAADVRMTTLSLVAFAIGLPGFMLVKVLAPAFFARQDARTPVRAALVTAGASLVMSLILMRTMVHVGLALAVSLGALINAGLLYRSLRGDGVYRPLPGWGPFLLRVIGACAAMGALLGVGPPELATWMRWDASIRVLGLLGWVGGAALVFGATLLGLGLRPRALLRSPGS